MELTAEQIQDNWKIFIHNIEKYISKPRSEKLIKFYENIEEVAALAPASSNESYHSCYPGGYVVHVNKVLDAALEIDNLWKKFGATVNHTTEELAFACINHDLGKLGISKDDPYYVKNESEWHVKNQGKIYVYNEKIPYMPVPDRSLFLLQRQGIELSLNETLAIKLHDGMYDKANENYLVTFYPTTKPRTYLIHLIHQADMMASRIEFEQWFFNDRQDKKITPVKKHHVPKQEIKDEALSKTLNKNNFQELLKNL